MYFARFLRSSHDRGCFHCRVGVSHRSLSNVETVIPASLVKRRFCSCRSVCMPHRNQPTPILIVAACNPRPLALHLEPELPYLKF